MNNMKYVSRLRIIALLGTVLASAILSGGCTKAPQVGQTGKITAKPPVKVSTETEGPREQAKKAETADKPSTIPEPINACKNLIELYEKSEELQKTGTLSPDLSTAIENKHKALLEQAKIFHFAEKLDLLATEIRMIGPEKARIYFLFRPNTQLTSDYQIGVNAKVDPAHEKYLSANANKEMMREEWVFWPPTTKEWTPEKEILITTEADLKPIPYQLTVGFFCHTPGSAHTLDNVDIGWYAGLGNEKYEENPTP